MKAASALLVAAAVIAPAQVLATGLVGRDCPGPPPVDCELYTAVSDTGPWSPCAPGDDGKYYRTKVLGIKTPAANGGACPDEDDPRRKIRELCPAADCIPLLPSEDTGPFGACEDRDNSGKFFKYKILGVKTPASNGGKCDSKDREYREPCTAVDCVVNTPAEDTGLFGNCIDKDNSSVFYKYRVLGIKVQPSNGGKACPPVDSPLREDKQLCAAVPCVVNTPEEDKGAFTDCEPERDSYSGKWYKYKTLGIKTPAQYGGSCPTEKEREYKELCPAQNCIPFTPEEDIGEYGPCTKNATDGKFYKSKTLGVKVNATYGGSCDPKDRQFSQACAAIDCVLFTEEEDKGPYGNCIDRDGSGKYYKYKILGIKSEAQNGGVDCPAVDNPIREVKQFCEPVDCVPLLPSEDNGPYGNCTDRDGTNVFYKYRTLGIKVNATNGGKCDPKDREDKQLCAAVPCVVNTPEEDKGNFSECEPERDSYSGKFYKYKTLGIKTEAQYGGSCPTVKEREYKELCPAQNCIPFTPEEDIGEYGPCLKNVTDGKFYKSKTLGVKVNATYGGTCDEKDRQFSQSCAAIDCVLFTEEEDKGPYGTCTDRDGSGKYYKYKILGIKSEAQYGGVDCPAVDNPIREVKQFCEPVDCVPLSKDEDKGPYGNCTDRDGTNVFYKYRTLGIKVNATNGGKCDPKDREDKEFCPAIPCVVNTPEEDTGNFTECKLEVGSYSGKYYKYKTLGIKTPAQNGGSCPSVKEREYKELCPAVPCVVYTPEEDPGKFGECKLEVGSYSGKWYKYKTLGIKTPAQYGGTCPSVKDREYKELCPPENCIPLSPAEDTGKFGPCTKNSTDGKYYKSKTLGVKVDAKYGGKCDAKDRQYSELCPPVDCVVNTPEEDKGEFGKCQKFPDGKYYKTKVLGIKTPASNGGSCPPETDPRRLVKQLCPSDGWCLPSDPFYDICIPKLAQCGAKKTNIVYSGKTISQTSGLALWQCCDKCATTAGCVAYTFLRDDNPKKTECYLKWKIDDIDNVYGDVVSSEPKSPKKKTCSYVDNWTLIATFTIDEFETDDLDACCTKCKATRNCKAFVISSSGTCYLKSGEGLEFPWWGSRSGYLS